MALSSELMLRLEAGEPLPKRLKLAENAYCSADLLVNRKEDRILEWLCNVTPTDLVAWKTLNLCIHCQSSNGRTTLSKKTKAILINALIDKLKLFKEENLPDVIMESCNWVLTTPEMLHYFQTKINKLGLFLQQFFIRLKSDQNNKISAKSIAAHNCVLNAIESLVKIHKQDTDKEKLAETFLNYVLSPLCALIDPNCKDNSNRIGAEAHKCMQQILFAKGRCAEYKEYFKAKGEGFLPEKLFRTIAQQASRKEGADHAPKMISYMFYAAAGSYKTESSLIDNLFRKFVNISGDFRTAVSNSLIVYMVDIPLEYTNEVDGVSLTEFLGNLINETLNKEDFSEEEYSLLRNITNLNPLIVENKLPIIFKKILLKRRETEAKERSYVQLMIGILNASLKLRREQKLISWVLLALHKALGENKDCNLSAAQILPVQFTAAFIVLTGRLNSSQIIVMLRSLTFHLKSNCVDEYEKGSRNQVSLMTECTVSLLVAFFEGTQMFEHTVPLATQQKFIVGSGQLGEVLSAFCGKILNTTHDGRTMVVLFEAVLSWSKVQSVLYFYAPKSGAGNMRFPISDNDLKQLIERVENFGDITCRNGLNRFLFHRITANHDPSKPQEKLTGYIGELKDSWTIILNDYPELVLILDFNQLSQLASLILTDIIGKGFDKWQETFEEEILQENRRFITAILCHALIKIGSVIEGSASAAITARIDPIKILQETKENATVPALNRTKLIQDIVQWPDLSNEDSSSIEKCLQTLLCIHLSSLSIPLRTMTFVIIYVISREFGRLERIKDLCDKILCDTLEEGGLNVFDFIEPTSLTPSLPRSRVLQKVFKMSLHTAEPVESLEHLHRLDSCSEEAVPAVLTCIGNLKSKFSNQQKQMLNTIEKTLGKKILSKVEKNFKSARRIQSLTVALKLAIGQNKVKETLKTSIRSTLCFTFLNDEKENLTDENRNFNGNDELIKEGLELAALALQHRARLDLPEELVANIWTMVLNYPETKLLIPLLEASVPKVFNSVLIDLHNQTKIRLLENNTAKLNNTLGIWNSVFKSDMGTIRNKCRLSATLKLLQTLQMEDIMCEHWPDLIRLLLTIINAKHMQLSGEYIDTIIMTASRSLREGNLLAYDEVLALCLALLRSRVGMMTDRLPILLQLFGQAVVLTTSNAKNENRTDRHQLALCALNIEKVTGALVKLKRDVLRVCPYVIAELVVNFAEDNLQDTIKESFKNCINNLLSICDSHGVALLLRALPPAKREIFKGLNETYNKFHRFTGKI